MGTDVLLSSVIFSSAENVVWFLAWAEYATCERSFKMFTKIHTACIIILMKDYKQVLPGGNRLLHMQLTDYSIPGHLEELILFLFSHTIFKIALHCYMEAF